MCVWYLRYVCMYTHIIRMVCIQTHMCTYTHILYILYVYIHTSFEIPRRCAPTIAVSSDPVYAYCTLQGGDHAQDAPQCRSRLVKEPLKIGIFCGKWPTQIRHPRHPVAASQPCSCDPTRTNIMYIISCILYMHVSYILYIYIHTSIEFLIYCMYHICYIYHMYYICHGSASSWLIHISRVCMHIIYMTCAYIYYMHTYIFIICIHMICILYAYI